MNNCHKKTKNITEMILKARDKAKKESFAEPEPDLTRSMKWPIDCTVGPGLEGAIACETKIGYVNGSKGGLIYRGYNIFDLCASSTFEEVSYLLLHGNLPKPNQLEAFKKTLIKYRNVPKTIRLLMGFPIEKMNTMAALRLGTNLMRQEFSYADFDDYIPDMADIIGTDEDSIPMETMPKGEMKAIYEYRQKKRVKRPKHIEESLHSAAGINSCHHLISGVSTIAAAISRTREGKLPVQPSHELSHAANLIYMMTGRIPTPEEERIMDICLILHADHGMNASTFASMVVASTLSDVYLSIGAGIAALNGPLHGGANAEVLNMLRKIGGPKNVETWYKNASKKKQKIMGFGHRVYKAYDPRARVLGPLANMLSKKDKENSALYRTATKLEKCVISSLGAKKGIFPNVDFYSGIVYNSMNIEPAMYTPIFAVSRVSGWAARVTEYLANNRIFRPRAIYTGDLSEKYVGINRR